MRMGFFADLLNFLDELPDTHIHVRSAVRVNKQALGAVVGLYGIKHRVVSGITFTLEAVEIDDAHLAWHIDLFGARRLDARFMSHKVLVKTFLHKAVSTADQGGH